MEAVREGVETKAPSPAESGEAASPKAATLLKRRDPASRRERVRAPLLFAASIALAVLGWSLLSLANPELVPSIRQTFDRGVQLAQSGALAEDIIASVWRVLLGSVIGSAAGIAVGFLIGWYRLIHGLMDPWIQFLRMIPPLGLLPVVVVYLGIGESAKVSVIAFSVFLVVVIAVVEGVRSASPVLVKAARAMGATDRQLFQTVILQGSIPYLLVGLRLGLASGWTTVVAAELIAASAGLGYLVQISGTEFDLAAAYVSLLFIGMIGLAMDLGLRAVERRITPWQERVRQ